MTNRWTALLAAASVAVLLPACDPAEEFGKERQNVQRVFERYLESIKTADTTLASQIWLHSPDIAVVTPFGRFKGWEAVRDNLYINFLQKAFTERNLQPDNLAITMGHNAAWAVFDWTFTAKFPNGQPYSSKGWESHVYRKTGGQWVIVQLHYSVPPPRPQ